MLWRHFGGGRQPHIMCPITGKCNSTACHKIRKKVAGFAGCAAEEFWRTRDEVLADPGFLQSLRRQRAQW
jgi:hypothetical protein